MAKIKNKKNIKENNRAKEGVKKVNPFEFHINKQKFKVIGQKLKNDHGLPGISRAKALKKRKNTLLPEFNLQHKTNQFLDRRIGEKNQNMTPEDKIIARFTAERIKVHKKKSIFNLGDDEILTHKGQTLTEIEKFDDPRSDDEESDDEKLGNGRLDADFVGDAHFGGGLLSKTTDNENKSRKDLIEELIAESKKRKAEKQKMREETIQLTEKLDSEWRDLLPLVSISKRGKDEPISEEVPTKPTVDDYDKMMRQLKFEARGHPTDRLKTEEEIAKEEKERLEKLEQDRLARMKGFINDKEAQPKHRSADDLDDDFVIDSDIEESQNKEEVADVEKPAEESEKEESEESDEDVETASEDDLSDLKVDESDSDEEDSKESEEEKEEEDDDDNGDDEKTPDENETIENESLKEKSTKEDLCKAKNTSPPHNSEKLKEPKKRTISTNDPPNSKKIKTDNAVETKEQSTEDKEKILTDLLSRKKIMEEARAELPYTFTIPDSYDAFKSLFESKSSTHQTIIVERMIKCTHPSLAESNKSKLNDLFIYLLKYIDEIFHNVSNESEIQCSFQFFDHIVPFLYELAHLNPTETHNSILESLKEKQANYRSKRKQYPKLDTIIYFKIISLLFPTSDFRHQIVTPAIVFMDQLLMRCKVKLKRDISTGLFLVTLILEYVTESKRFLPAAINFLRGIFHMAVPKRTIRAIPIIPPFKTFCSLLVLPEKYTDPIKDYMMSADDLLENEIEDEYKIRVLYTAIKICSKFYIILETLPSSVEIFDPILDLLKQIPIENYPEPVEKEYEKLISQIENGKINRKLDFLVVAAQRPKALRLYEPNIQQVFENRKHRNISKDKAERDKLIHKLKKEKKGALREIRRDNAFLTKLKINEQMRSDMERKQKVKEIFSEAAVQQSELNSLDRKKKKKK